MDLTEVAKKIRSDLESLHPFTATPGNGTTRLPFTKEARGGADQVKALMSNEGLTVREDEAGNILGTLKGEDPSLPAIVVGSHYDTVINGGNFDGLAGVISGIAVVHLLKQAGCRLKRDYVVVAFNDEEGIRFTSGYFGSRACLGEIPREDLHTYKDADGISIYDAMTQYGLTPEELPCAAWKLDSIKAFIEMHIEQGPVLDNEKTNLGLVECIVGIRRYMVTIQGRPDHAGTTPMNMRMDAVEAAAKVIAKLPDRARENGEDTVATTGFIKVLPNGMNIVAEKVQFSIDVRSRNNQVLADMQEKIKKDLEDVCSETRTEFEMEEKLVTQAVSLNADMLDIMESSCKSRSYSYRRMVSGAGHDAAVMGHHVDTVMLFAPSKGGRSHCPAEWTDYEDLARATTVMYDLILALQ